MPGTLPTRFEEPTSAQSPRSCSLCRRLERPRSTYPSSLDTRPLLESARSCASRTDSELDSQLAADTSTNVGKGMHVSASHAECCSLSCPYHSSLHPLPDTSTPPPSHEHLYPRLHPHPLHTSSPASLSFRCTHIRSNRVFPLCGFRGSSRAADVVRALEPQAVASQGRAS